MMARILFIYLFITLLISCKSGTSQNNDNNSNAYHEYSEDGYNEDGYNEDGYNEDGYNEDGYDENGFDTDGFDFDGNNEQGYNRNESISYVQESHGYEDGTYDANVDYFNPDTQYSATYDLEVEVEDNHVVTIYFPKGGYLDGDHIRPRELDVDGYVRIISDLGYEYRVRIVD